MLIFKALYGGKDNKMDHRTDKKANSRYWDEIDALIEKMVMETAEFSDTKINSEELDDIVSDGIVADVREMVINYLKEKGGEFPYVDENM